MKSRHSPFIGKCRLFILKRKAGFEGHSFFSGKSLLRGFPSFSASDGGQLLTQRKNARLSLLPNVFLSVSHLCRSLSAIYRRRETAAYYFLGLRMFACAVPTFERAIYRPFECCIISLDYVQYLYSTTTSQLVFVFILRK